MVVNSKSFRRFEIRELAGVPFVGSVVRVSPTDENSGSFVLFETTVLGRKIVGSQVFLILNDFPVLVRLNDHFWRYFSEDESELFPTDFIVDEV